MRDPGNEVGTYLPLLSRHLAVVPSPRVSVVLLKDFHSLLRRTSLSELPPVVMTRCCYRISVKEKYINFKVFVATFLGQQKHRLIN